MKFLALIIAVLVLGTSCEKEAKAINESRNKAFFRIQEVDTDGKVMYSDTRMITIN